MATKTKRALFGDRLRDAREAAGFTSQEALARKVGKRQQEVQRWEATATAPPVYVRAKLERSLGLEPLTIDAWIRECPKFGSRKRHRRADNSCSPQSASDQQFRDLIAA